MKRLELIQDKIYQSLEEKCYGIKKQQAYHHLFSVSTISIMLSNKRKLDNELAGIIGLLHDYSTYLLHNNFDHAIRSSNLANEMLTKTNLFSEKEINIIITAIKNHSNKDKVDDEYSELIKDADLLYLATYDPEVILSEAKLKRLNK